MIGKSFNPLITLITVQTFFIFHSSAQTSFKAGIVGGIAFTQIDGDGYSGFDKAGINAGGFVNNHFGWEKTSLQMELLYVNKGSRKPPNPEKGISYYQINLNYVEIPLLVKYRYKKLCFEGGLSYAQLVRHREFDTSGELTEKEYPPFKNSEFALNLGAGYFFNEKFSLNIRSVRSILPVRDYAVFTQFGFFGLTSSGIFGGSYNTVVAYSLRYQFGKVVKKEESPKEKNSKNIFKNIIKLE